MKKLLIFLMCAILSLSFTGCSSSNDESVITGEITNSWNQASEEYEDDSFMALFDTKSSFTTDAVENTDDGVYTVTCSVTSPDILEQLKSYQASITEVPSNETMNSKVIEFINAAEPKTTQHTVTVYETKAFPRQ